MTRFTTINLAGHVPPAFPINSKISDMSETFFKILPDGNEDCEPSPVNQLVIQGGVP